MKHLNRTGWWFGTFFIFPYMGILIPTDELIFSEESRYTTNQRISNLRNYVGLDQADEIGDLFTVTGHVKLQ